jgi:hypothetical protein
MTYKIHITPHELRSLAWLADRYEYASALYDYLHESGDEPDVWLLPEHRAWQFNEAGLFPCLGGELLTKIIDLWQDIV